MHGTARQATNPENVKGWRGFVAPMKNVEWVEVQPLHQLGAFKWKVMELAVHARRHAGAQSRVGQTSIDQFHAAGCRVR